MESQRKYRDIKLATTERRKNYLVLGPHIYTTKFFTKTVLATEMKKTEITANKPVYLGLVMIDISKITIYNFWYDYIKVKFDER